MKATKLLILLLCVSSYAWCQTTIKGTVYSLNKEPLPYVTIGIPNVNIGTYSFEDGSFEITIPNKNKNDFIQFSHVGYKTTKATVADLLKTGAIYLEGHTTELDEIVIKKKSELEVIGIVKKSSSSSIKISKPFNGAEIAVLLNLDAKEFTLKEISLNVLARNLNNYTIRVKVYDVDTKTQLPKNIINTQEIKTTFATTKGRVNFKLKESIEVNKPIFISFEWLATKKTAILISNTENRKSNKILNKYTSNKCAICSKVIYNNKTVNFINNKGKVIEMVKLNYIDRKLIKTLEQRLPQLAFQTTKSNIPTYYRYTSLGKWYKYSQTLIANVRGYID